MTGPIIFQRPEPRQQLQEHGEVFTFRATKRTTGRTWWRASRTGEKEGDCVVTWIEYVDPSNPFDLDAYQYKSGFDSVPEWMEVIKEMHGGFPELGHMFRVTAVDS